MTTITWKGGADLNWFSPLNWIGNSAPQAGDDAVIGGSVTVTIDASSAAAAGVTLTGGAALQVASNLALSGTLAGSLLLSGTLTGGTLTTAPVTTGGTLVGVSLAYAAPVLGGVVIDPATAASAAIGVAGTLTLTPGLYGGSITLDPTLVQGVAVLQAGIGSGAVTIAPAGTVLIGEAAALATTLPPAESVGITGALLNEGTISGNFGYAASADVTIGGASFVNRGLVSLDPVSIRETLSSGPAPHSTTTTYTEAFGPTLDISAADFVNLGTINLAGGTLELTGATASNQGVIALSDVPTQFAGGPGTLTNEVVIGTAGFSNTGTITADMVAIAAALSLAALGSIDGQLLISGTLDLGGGTLDATHYGSVFVTGTVRDGTLKSGTGTLTILGGAALDAVTVDQPGGITVYGPNTLEGIPAGATAVTLDAATVKLDFAAAASITGVGITAGGAGIADTLALDAGTVTLDAASTLTLLGGTLTVSGPGTLADDGSISVNAGTLSLGAALIGSGSLAVAAGATLLDSGTVGGTLTITLGANAAMQAATLEGGAVTLGTGATLSATQLDGGAVSVGQNATLSAGTLGGTATITLDAGSAATITALSGSPTVDFAGGSALLVLPGTGAVGVTLIGLAATDLIDFTGVSSTPAQGFGAGGAGLANGALQVTGASGDTAHAPVSNVSAGLLFSTGGDGTGGTLVTAQACYAAGTRIVTARGAIAVERLRPGDLVRTVAGQWRPITRLTRQRVDGARHPRPADAWPVCVAAHAVAPGRPARDLWLSPDHALLLEGVLIPVRYLLNGATVRQMPAGMIEYWHVALPTHDVLLAENLPAESFLPTEGRAALVLRQWRAHGAARLVTAGPKLAAARARLLARAAALGHRQTDDPDLAVLADGRRLRRRAGGFDLPRGTEAIRLLSRSFVPAEFGVADGRRLGIAVAALSLDEAALALADARLAAGWHAAEPHWRWTGGDALIAAGGARRFALTLAMSGRYWRAPG